MGLFGSHALVILVIQPSNSHMFSLSVCVARPKSTASSCLGCRLILKPGVSPPPSFLPLTGSLQIWYHLQTDRNPDVFSPALNNLADGRLHRIRIHRVGRNLYVQVRRHPASGPKKSRRSGRNMTWLGSRSCISLSEIFFFLCLLELTRTHVAFPYCLLISLF